MSGHAGVDSPGGGTSRLLVFAGTVGFAGVSHRRADDGAGVRRLIGAGIPPLWQTAVPAGVRDVQPVREHPLLHCGV